MVRGKFPMTQELATTLAALQLCVKYGGNQLIGKKIKFLESEKKNNNNKKTTMKI